MNYTVSNILKDVRVVLDENEATTALIAADSDTLSLEDIITQKIPQAVRLVSEAAPSSLMDDAKPFTGAVVWGDNYSGSIVLPSDFMRLVLFMMSDWRRPVDIPILATDPEYRIQKSPFSGVRGNTEKPVCAIISLANNNVLEFYSCRDNTATVKIAKYVAIPAISGGTIDICRKLYDSVIYYIAGLTCATYKDQHSEALFAISKSFLEP